MDEQKPYHHTDLKNTLVVAGLAILAEQGVNELSLRAVARRGGSAMTGAASGGSAGAAAFSALDRRAMPKVVSHA